MMDEVSAIRQLLDREINLHRELLALARLRHCLLRQRRWTEAMRLRWLEETKVSHLRTLEALRSRLAGRFAKQREIATHLASAARRIASLIRQLGAVERATQRLWKRYAVLVHSSMPGVAVWAPRPLQSLPRHVDQRTVH